MLDFIGRGEVIRTLDPLHPMQALQSAVSYCFGYLHAAALLIFYSRNGSESQRKKKKSAGSIRSVAMQRKLYYYGVVVNA